MFPMPMPHHQAGHGVADAGPISRLPVATGRQRDAVLSVKLYSWSSEEFHKECALFYTSRSNPSQTCISHWRANRNKVIFTLQDHSCEGNPVLIHFEVKAKRDRKGSYKIGEFRTRNLSGKFLEQADQERGLSVRRYRDKFRLREGEFKYVLVKSDEAKINFTTGVAGGQALTYVITVRCHGSNGMDDGVVLEGPDCCFMDANRDMSRIGLCSLRYFERKPSSKVLEQLENDVLNDNNNIQKASSSSSSSTTQQSSAILNNYNAGGTRVSFDAAMMQGRSITFGALTDNVSFSELKEENKSYSNQIVRDSSLVSQRYSERRTRSTHHFQWSYS